MQSPAPERMAAERRVARQPVRVVPPPDLLPPLKFLPAVVRNPIEVWPQAVYEEPTYRRRLLSRETLFVMDPDLVRSVLVENADKFDKSQSMLRSLGPALGRGLLTADGPHWRWQRRAAAPIFRHERILDFVPEMIAAADDGATPGSPARRARSMLRTR